MAFNTLKYGTLVLVGLATVGGYYYEPGVDRVNVRAKDIIEIIEGLAEREYIALSNSGNRTITIQMATNREQLIALDIAISNVIPHFVDQTRIDEWLATTNLAPYRWTYASVCAAAGLADGLPPYPLQITKDSLTARYNVLRRLRYTDDPSSWSTNLVWTTNQTHTYGSYTQETVKAYLAGDDNVTNRTEADRHWAQYVVANEPDWFSTNMSDTYATYTFSPTNTTPTTTVGAAPKSSFSTSTSVTKYDFVEETTYYSSLGYFNWDRYYNTWKEGSGSWSSGETHSKLKGTARALDLTRIDYYYGQAAELEHFAVTSNTQYTITSVYDKPVPTNGLSSVTMTLNWTNEFVFTYDPSTPPGYARSLRINTAAGSGYHTGSDSRSGAVTNIGPRNVIHKWDVTRCYLE